MAKTVMRPLSYVHSSLVLAIKMALFHISVHIFFIVPFHWFNSLFKIIV